MKILHICPDFPVYSKGGQTFRLLSELWISMGHEVTVLTSIPPESKGNKELLDLNFQILGFRISSISKVFPEALIFFPLSRGQKEKLIYFLQSQSSNYDVILVHGILETLSRISIKNIPEKRKLILTNHGISLGSFNPVIKLVSTIAHLTLGNILIRNFRVITLYSLSVREQQEAFFGSMGNKLIRRFPLGIDTSALKHIFSKQTKSSGDGIKTSDPYILAIGRHVRIKGFQLLIKAFSTVRKEFPELKLVIAGKRSEYTDKLIALSNSLGIRDHAIILDYVDEEEKLELIMGCSVFVIPSIQEGYGLNAVLAAILNVPTVATNTGGHQEILLNNRNAIIVKPNSAKELAKGIETILKNRSDVQLQLNEEMLQKYDIRTTAKEYINIFINDPTSSRHF